MEACWRVDWQDLLAYLLDVSWPADHPVQAELLLSDRIRVASEYIYVDAEEEDDEDEKDDAEEEDVEEDDERLTAESIRKKEKRAKELEKLGIANAAETLLQSSGRISGKRLADFVIYADELYSENGYSFTAALVEAAAENSDPSDVCAANAAEIFLALRIPPREMRLHFRTLMKSCGLKVDIPFLFGRAWGLGEVLGGLAAMLSFIQSERHIEATSDLGTATTMCANSRSLLHRVIQRLGTGPCVWGEGDLTNDELTWRRVLGLAVEVCFNKLDQNGLHPGRKTLRNVGLVFGSVPQTPSSWTIGGIPVFRIEKIQELLKSPEDALNFASGFLARRPGPQAIAMINSASGATKNKGELLEQLLALSTEFGEIDEVLDGGGGERDSF